jgi:hypothetical protein
MADSVYGITSREFLAEVAKSCRGIVFFFYEDAPRIPNSLFTVDAHAVTESRRDRNRPRGHMMLTGAR